MESIFLSTKTALMSIKVDEQIDPSKVKKLFIFVKKNVETYVE